MPQTKSTKNKILWLSIVQGWAILLVVIGHVNCFTYSGADGEFYPFGKFIHEFCYAFHMPLFMFVSGGMLYYTRISRDWSVGQLYKDKFHRLFIPYVVFTAIAFGIKALFASQTKRGLDVSAGGFLNAFFDPYNGPLGEMWFIGALMWLMFMYPVYKVMLRNPWTEILLLLIALTPFFFTDQITIKGWFSLDSVFSYAIYFVGGILYFKYELYRKLNKNLGLTLIFTLIFAALLTYKRLSDTPDSRLLLLLLASAGILMSFGWGMFASEKFPNLFHHFRDHSFQIFLVGIFPQMFVELIVWKRFHPEWMQLPYFLISCILAIVCAVAVSRVGSKSSNKWIRCALGLK